MFSNLLGIYLRVEFLSLLVMLFNFLRNWQTTFQSGCTVLHSYQQPMSIPSSPYLLLPIFIIMAILVVGKWHLQIMSFISIFLQHLFMCLLAIHISFLENYLLRSFPIFIGLFGFLLLSYRMSLYILDIITFSDMWFGNILSHFVACLFSYLMVSLQAQKCMILMWSNLSTFFFCCLWFLKVNFTFFLNFSYLQIFLSFFLLVHHGHHELLNISAHLAH